MIYDRRQTRQLQKSKENDSERLTRPKSVEQGSQEQAIIPRPSYKFDFNSLYAQKTESEPIQAKSAEYSSTEVLKDGVGVNEAIAQEKSEETPNQTGLPDVLKAGVEHLSGYSLDDVRVHYNSPKPAQLQALAYTQGTEIHVAPGQEKHLPHEAWHVVQQMQGRVKPTMQMKGIEVNDDEGLEREADMMGKLANKGNVRVAQLVSQGEREDMSFLKVPASLYIHKTVQRYPRVGETEKASEEATSWQKVSDFLKRYNQHVFHGFSVDLKSKKDNNVVFSQIEGTFIGEEGAKKLSVQLLKVLKEGLTDEKNPHGQKVIMRKLAEIMELVRTARNDLEEDKVRALEISQQLYHDDGLCYGFTEIYKRHARWEMALWNSIAEWQPSGGSTNEELCKLNKHLEETINWASGDFEARSLEATLLLKEAWEYMEQEEYGKLTEAFSEEALKGTAPEVEPTSLGQTTRLIKTQKDVEELITEVKTIVLSIQSTPLGLVMEISTDFHSMMASYQLGQLAFCEPELWGIVLCTWDELQTMLNKTLVQMVSTLIWNSGFALDIDIHAQIPQEKSEKEDDTSNLLKSLNEVSLKSFEGVEKGSDHAKFLKDYNEKMYEFLFSDG